MNDRTVPEQCLMVIFGASGDLTARKLVPALYDLCRTQQLPRHMGVLGVSRTKMSDGEFREKMRASCADSPEFSEETWRRFAERLHYEPCDATDFAQFGGLVRRIDELRQTRNTGESLLFYLSVAPSIVEQIVFNIGAAGLVTEGKRWCSIRREQAPWQRVIVEKPFGYDLESARHLARVIGRVFDDTAVFNIDHYLGKETVQNLLVFRFANLIFEPLWNRHYVDHVQITASEMVGVEDRGDYFEASGALRDMIQSHLLQVLALVAMEPPNSAEADDLRIEQRKALSAIRPFTVDDASKLAVRGQYAAGEIDRRAVSAYRDEPKVDPQSTVETYAALRLFVDNWRWRDVPFLLRTGKRMRRKLTQIVVAFKPTPHIMFHDVCDPRYLGVCRPPNRLVINVQPDEGINLRFEGKVPGQDMRLQSAVMDFDFKQQFGGDGLDAYATLLLDAMRGDQALFKDRHEIEAAWRVVQPVLEHWSRSGPDDLAFYPAGSWGPDEAQRLFPGYGEWRNPEGKSSRSRLVN